MEIIKVKCLKCFEITSILKELIIPHQGKVISIKCSNPQCGKPLKVQVPNLNLEKETKKNITSDYAPTQILIPNRVSISTARLRILKNEKTEEQTFTLKEGLNTIGRFSLNQNSPLPDIPIFTMDKKISRNRHCEIFLQKSKNSYEVIIRDKASKNGTFLLNSEKPLRPEDEIFLNNNDLFIIGETKIRIELD